MEQQHQPQDRKRYIRTIWQSIRCEEYCPTDQTAQEDYVWDRLCELVEENAYDTDTAQEAYDDYRIHNHNDMVVRHLGQQAVSRPFYE